MFSLQKNLLQSYHAQDDCLLCFQGNRLWRYEELFLKIYNKSGHIFIHVILHHLFTNVTCSHDFFCCEIFLVTASSSTNTPWLSISPSVCLSITFLGTISTRVLIFWFIKFTENIYFVEWNKTLFLFECHLSNFKVTQIKFGVYWHFLENTWKECHVSTFGMLMYLMMTSSNGNIFRVTGHLYGEFTGPQWIPRTKASDTDLWCFLWCAPE